MPTMYEIYDAHADRYEELVRAEDCQGNFARFLREVVEWRGARVLEAGMGTGRVTRLYLDMVASAVCCDRSPHMLEYARRHLPDRGQQYLPADNTDLPLLQEPVDIVIEGWSFGHTVTDEGCSPTTVPAMTELLLENAFRNLKPEGAVILIETLGTNEDAPAPPHQNLGAFYRELEEHHRFRRFELRTDYQFSSNAEAVRIMGFFFGPAMRESVRRRGTATIPEWTGLWLKP